MALVRKGRPRTPEERARISESMKKSAAARAAHDKMRGTKRGQLSLITRARMSASKKAKRGTPEWTRHVEAFLLKTASVDRLLETGECVNERPEPLPPVQLEGTATD